MGSLNSQPNFHWLKKSKTSKKVV